MQTKHHFHIQESTIASMIALGVFGLAILFVAFVLPAIPGLMEKSYQQGIPMQEFSMFENIHSER